MTHLTSNTQQLIARIHWLKIGLPLTLAIVVVFYQLGVTQALEQNYGHLVHYSFEIGFYSLTGPVATWLMLRWVERNLLEKARIEIVAQRLSRERAEIIEEERERIARDLHDSVAQTLYFVALQADLAGQLVSKQPAKVTETLKEIGANTRRVIKDVRLTIFSLQPLAWAEGNFLAGLKKFVLALGEQAGWQITVMLPEEEGLIPITLQSTIFRLINESLINVAKHARAQHVEIHLRRFEEPGALDLTIIDDGLGFEPGIENGAGLGLAQLRSRVAAIGGLYEISSEPEKGTLVHFRLPIPEKSQ